MNYKEIYIKALGYDRSDFIPSELSGTLAVDIHHILAGAKREDRIENLMAVTRNEHVLYGDRKMFMVELLTKHMNFLAVKGVPFDMNWFDEKINYYKSITA